MGFDLQLGEYACIKLDLKYKEGFGEQMMIRLTNRLYAIAKQVQEGASVADIGTDHGYVPVYLIQNHIAKKIIATDIHQGPLKIAQNTIAEYGLQSYIELRLGNGLEVISPGEVDTVIVAGMGGLLIRDILSQHIETARTIHRFILQPMNAQAELREWLLKNAFKIIHEELAMEGQRIYEIIVAENGHQEIGERINLEISPKLIQKKDPLLRIFIQKKIQKQREIIAHLSEQNTEKAIHRLKECKDKLQQLEGVLKCLRE